MASRRVLTDAQVGFSGGMMATGIRYDGVLTNVATVIPPNAYPFALNMKIKKDGELAPRRAFRQLATQSTLVWATAWNDLGSTGVPNPQVIAIDSAGVLQYGTFNTSTSTFGFAAAGTSVGTTAGGNAAAHFRDATLEQLYIGDSSTKIHKFDGSTVTNNIGTPSGIQSLWTYNQRLFGCKSTDQTLYWSGLNDGDSLGTTATGGGSATIRAYGGGDLLGGFALGSTNYLVHTNALSMFEGRSFDDIQIQAGVQGLLPGVTPIDATSFRAIDGVGYIVTARGLLTIRPGEAPTYYDTPDTPDAFLAVLAANFAIRKVSIADNVRANEIWFCLTVDYLGGSTPSQMIVVYSKQFQRFISVWTTTETPLGVFDGMSRWSFSSQTSVLPQAFMFTAGGVFGCDFADQNLEVTTGYGGVVYLRRMYTDAPQNTKAWRRMYVLMGSGYNDRSVAGVTPYGTATSVTVSYTVAGNSQVNSSISLLAQATTQVPLSGFGPYIDAYLTGAGTVDWSLIRADVEGFDYGSGGR